MPYKDSSTTGGKVRVKNSMVAGEAIGANGLSAGELAVNAADGAMYYRTAGGSVGTFPSATGFLRIEALNQTQYDALVASTATLSTTLYIVTPAP